AATVSKFVSTSRLTAFGPAATAGAALAAGLGFGFGGGVLVRLWRLLWGEDGGSGSGWGGGGSGGAAAVKATGWPSAAWHSPKCAWHVWRTHWRQVTWLCRHNGFWQ